jgi:hypothetical protein
MTLSKTLQAKISKDKEIETYIKLLQENQTEIFMYNYNLNYNSAMESKKMDLKTYIDDYHPYLAVDDDLVQRIFDRWLPAAIQSYLIDLVTGNAVKDLILIADIQSIVDEIEEQLENTDEDDIQKVKSFTTLFQGPVVVEKNVIAVLGFPYNGYIVRRAAGIPRYLPTKDELVKAIQCLAEDQFASQMMEYYRRYHAGNEVRGPQFIMTHIF